MTSVSDSLKYINQVAHFDPYYGGTNGQCSLTDKACGECDCVPVYLPRNGKSIKKVAEVLRNAIKWEASVHHTQRSKLLDFISRSMKDPRWTKYDLYLRNCQHYVTAMRSMEEHATGDSKEANTIKGRVAQALHGRGSVVCTIRAFVSL